jgi:hypothetical protein
MAFMEQFMFSKAHVLIILLCSSLSVSSYANSKKPLAWQIKNKTWTKSYEKSYEEFIASIGKAKQAGVCHTTSDCIKSSIANPQFYNLNPDSLMDVFSDCADLPYILRAYFSWMNDLPFTYPVELTQAPLRSAEADALMKQLDDLYVQLDKAGMIKKQVIKRQIKELRKKIYGGSGVDIRYNSGGNKIVSKLYVKNGDNINKVLVDVANAISTATFRTDAANNTTSKLFRDTYPVVISKAAIKPGTVLYDPNGHVAVVFDVTKNGKVHLIDAHPDNSLTAITYGEKFSQTNVEIGGGFSNWRPFNIETGEVQAATNEELPDYSLEQFERKKPFEFNNVQMSFHEYVRNKLSQGALIYYPVTELNELMEEICHDVKEREMAVNASLAAGIQNQSHPDQLPSNIYGTDGDWESYSSPSRDARLKASIREGRQLMQKIIQGHKDGDKNVQYDGQDLEGDLQRTYEASASKCTIDVKKTSGGVQTLTLNTILKNIFKLSFDPYHCMELRWGLTDAESLKSCNQSKDKIEWYNAEQGLRNLIDRDYSVKMDYSLRELPSMPISKTPEENISIVDVLN